MEFEIWHYWILASILFLIMEIFVPSFIVANFGIGALFGALVALLNGSIEMQIIVFSITTLASFFTVRPVLLKYAYKRSGDVKTNTDAIVGKTGVITEEVNATVNTGRVDFEGSNWIAKSIDGSVITTGQVVEIVRIDSIIFYVKPKSKN